MTKSTTHPILDVIAGHAVGAALVLDEPLSFWGGLDSRTGQIIDQHHPQHGLLVTDTILLMPFGRGSSSASSVIAEAVRLHTGPRALMLLEADEIVTLGALVAEELYGTVTPICVAEPAIYEHISTGDMVTVAPGSVTITIKSS